MTTDDRKDKLLEFVDLTICKDIIIMPWIRKEDGSGHKTVRFSCGKRPNLLALDLID